MTDDLVKRLRELNTFEWHARPATTKETCFAAADRIEKLEAQLAQSQLKRWAARWEEQADRIEKLEAALDDVAGYLARADWYYLKPETRKALEGKDD